MNIDENNLLSLPLTTAYNSEDGETILSLSLGIKCDHELKDAELWEAKKEFVKQLKFILDQLVSE